MNTLFLSSEMASALGWAIIHSLWQITFIWLIYKVLSRLFNNWNNLVYAFSIVAMGVSAGWTVVTFFKNYLPDASGIQTIGMSVNQDILLQQNLGIENITTVSNQDTTVWLTVENWLNQNVDYIGTFWLLIMLLLLFRMAGGWWLANRLKTRNVSIPENQFVVMCEKWSKKMHITRAVKLQESPYIHEPLTIGFWKPVVLFPVGMLTQLSVNQVEVLLIHELTHIRRFDYLINMLQILLETIFFYHPLFRLLSKDARIRREYACDDSVVKFSASPILYAKTLTQLQTDLIHFQNAFVMKSIGKDHFTTRILRIAGVKPQSNQSINWLIALLLPLLFLFVSPNGGLQADSSSLQAAEFNIGSKPDTEKTSVIKKSNTGRQFDKVEKVVENQAVNTIVFTNDLTTLKGDSTSPAVVAIVPEKMNVLYIGVDNPLTIAVAGYDCEDLVVKPVESVQGLSIQKMGSCKYNVTAKAPGLADIQVYIVENGKERLVGNNKFRIKRIPDPTPMMNGMRSKSISFDELKLSKGIEVLIANFDFDDACSIVSYQVTTLVKGQNPSHEFIVRQAEFPERIKSLFNELAAEGGQIFFDNILVKCPGDTNSRNLGGLSFKIKPADKE